MNELRPPLIAGNVYVVSLASGECVVMPVEDQKPEGVHIFVLDCYDGWEPKAPTWFPRGCVLLEAKRMRVA